MTLAARFTRACGHAETLVHSRPVAPRWIPARPAVFTRPRSAAGIALVGLGVASIWLDTQPLHAEAVSGTTVLPDPLDALSPIALNDADLHLVTRSFGELLRAYATYLASSSSLVVDATSLTLSALEKVREVVPLGLGELPWKCAEYLIRCTAFALFAGGESAVGTYPLLDRLAAESTSGLLCYSAEAEEAVVNGQAGSALARAHVDETLRAIRAAGEYPPQRPGMAVRPTWVAIKLTGLVHDPTVLERASEALTSSSSYLRGERLPPSVLFPASPGISVQDQAALEELQASLRQCAALARQLKVRVDVDAEQSWFQPAIDRFYELLAQEYNRPTDGLQVPIVFQTYQCYRQDARDRMHADQAWSKQHGLLFGAKLVRGAYVESEKVRAKRLRRANPIWPDKEATDRCYDACASDLTDEIIEDVRRGRHRVTNAMFASHNAHSTRLILERFRRAGLMHNDGHQLDVDERLRGRIIFAQLLGMADNLTATLTKLLERNGPVDATDDRNRPQPYVLKYIPYGRVDQVMPYLLRRAQENKAVLAGDNSRGGVRHERKAVGRELRRRLFG